MNGRVRRVWGPVATFTAERQQLAIVATGPQQALVVAELARQPDITHKAAQLRQTIAVLAGHLALWEARGQLGALDGYLSAVAYRRQSGTLPQYRDFNDAVKSAALILRGTTAAAVAAVAEPVPPPPAEATHEDQPAAALYLHDSATGTLVLAPTPDGDPAPTRTDLPAVTAQPWGDLDGQARENLAALMAAHDEEDAAKAGTDPLPSVGKWEDGNGDGWAVRQS